MIWCFHDWYRKTPWSCHRARRARPARRSRPDSSSQTAAAAADWPRIANYAIHHGSFLGHDQVKGWLMYCLPTGRPTGRPVCPCLKRVRRIEPIHGVKMAFGKVTSLGTPDSQNVLSQNCNSLRDEFVSKDFSWSIVDLTVHHGVKTFKNSHFNK